MGGLLGSLLVLDGESTGEADLDAVTGVHDIYFKFGNASKVSGIALMTGLHDIYLIFKKISGSLSDGEAFGVKTIWFG